MKINTLKGKTIVITGGSLGIGLTVSRFIAKYGGRVVIAARNKAELILALNQINLIANNNHKYYQLDVGNICEVEKFSHWCSSEIGEINGLINCAGIYGPIGKSTEIDLKEFEETIRINFLGVVYMCNLLRNNFSTIKKNKIINFSGGGASTPFPNYSAYATSKIALVRFTENLSLELSEDNFDINCIAPGFVLTRLHQQTLKTNSNIVGEDFYQNTLIQLTKGGVSPDLAAKLTVFLLSDKSDGISGKFISAPWDPWETDDFIDLMKNDKDFCTLRRIDNKSFFKK